MTTNASTLLHRIEHQRSIMADEERAAARKLVEQMADGVDLTPADEATAAVTFGPLGLLNEATLKEHLDAVHTLRAQRARIADLERRLGECRDAREIADHVLEIDLDIIRRVRELLGPKRELLAELDRIDALREALRYEQSALVSLEVTVPLLAE